MWQFLSSSDGVLLGHSVILLAVAVIGYLSARIHRQAREIDRKLESHIKISRLRERETRRALRMEAPPDHPEE